MIHTPTLATAETSGGHSGSARRFGNYGDVYQTGVLGTPMGTQAVTTWTRVPSLSIYSAEPIPWNSNVQRVALRAESESGGALRWESAGLTTGGESRLPSMESRRWRHYALLTVKREF